MSPNNPLIPTKPVEITLDTLPQLFAHHRARFGGWTMTETPPEQAGTGGQQPPEDQSPQRPEGISDEEWNALGDPGRVALVREREARQAAERTLAASRARPAAPKPQGQQGGQQQAQQNGSQGQQGSAAAKSGEVDVEAIVQRAVQAAVKPFQEAEERRETEKAADRIRDAVLEAAKPRLHDATDALAGIDLTVVVNEQGQADAAKIKTALDDLVTRKPHLAKTGERQAPAGIGGGAPAGATSAEKVKAVLADMQRATGVRNSATTSN